ncbi:MAG: glycerophosphodiester phosphodiesterase [Verrucomicrobiales bacterium]|nr:glycerophosphodiester phosphodiesterase [Verrucomicrobiales bacterium]
MKYSDVSRFSFAILMSLTISKAAAFEIVGHRGASFDAPENSLASMKLAWVQKADGIETDISLSKDGKMVVMHDDNTKRTGGVDKKIADHTWDELKDIDIGKWKGPQFTGEKIPTLESFFATIPDGKCIFTEIKLKDSVQGADFEKAKAILDELDKAMTASGKKPNQLRIITFHYNMAKAAKERFPKHPVYWLAGYTKDKKTGKLPDIDELIQKAKDAKVDGLDLNSGFPMNKAFVKKVHKAGLKLYTWTVDDPEVARAEKKAGVDGITTNRPEFLRAELKK